MLLRTWLVFLRVAGCVEAAQVDKKQAKRTADPYGMTTKKQATEPATVRGFPRMPVSEDPDMGGLLS
jgi:hypothetical protein